MAQVYLDTNLFIAAFEARGEVAEEAWTVFRSLAVREPVGVTSELTLAELLPKPIASGQNDLADFYLELLSGKGFIDVVPVTRAILVESGAVRAKHPTLRLPDTVHLATANLRRCAGFVSNDRRLPLSPDMQAIVLDASIVENIARLGR